MSINQYPINAKAINAGISGGGPPVDPSEPQIVLLFRQKVSSVSETKTVLLFRQRVIYRQVTQSSTLLLFRQKVTYNLPAKVILKFRQRVYDDE